MHCTESADYTSAEPAKYVQLHTNVIAKFSSVKTHLVQAEKTIHLRCQIIFSNFSEGGRHTGVRDHGEVKYIPLVFVCCLYPRNCKLHQIL